MHLPRTSAFMQAVGGPEARWGDLEHLVASLIETVAASVGVEYRVKRPGDLEREEKVRRARRDRAIAREAERQRQLAELEARKEAT